MRTLLALAAALLSSPAFAQTPTAPAVAPEGYRLLWSDEFDTPGLPDPAKWTYDTHANRTGWYNNELQYYAAGRPENARVENGNLVIEARRESLTGAPDHGGQHFTSARLLSRTPHGGWTYGLFEARIKLPCARGTWPAFWMLPDNASAWPNGGEIDILEHVGHRAGTVFGTIHTGAFNHVRHTEKQGNVQLEDACTAFHVYQALWTPEAVVFSVDDQPYYRFANDGSGDRMRWPFDAPFHLILNIAVGGDWGGQEGVDETAFPQAMQVDWVRVWGE
ncbi:glycoside hydrolase family 16 protein [Brevundimonas sp.]|uniref:glycoside hydrolase family 16 protein n=1 Tax=Brevundimonas sp. TaxID=1871086 RepID=UPI003F71162F